MSIWTSWKAVKELLIYEIRSTLLTCEVLALNTLLWGKKRNCLPPHVFNISIFWTLLCILGNIAWNKRYYIFVLPYKLAQNLKKSSENATNLVFRYTYLVYNYSCNLVVGWIAMLVKHILVFKSSNATVRVIILIFWLHKDLNSKRSWLIGMQTHFYVIHQVHLLCVSIDDEAFIFFYQFSSFLSIMQYIR